MERFVSIAMFGRECEGMSTNVRYSFLLWEYRSTKGMAAIGRTFGSSQSFRKLNLSRNERIKDEGVIALCTNASDRCRELGLAYYSFPALQELNLAHCGIGAAGMEALVELLGNFGGDARGRSLSLVLNGNPVGADACCALASLLCDSLLVTSLSIADCNIGNADMSILSAAVGIDSCDGVTMLDLSNNNIGADGAKSLASSLSCWTRLEDLRLSGNDLSEAGVQALFEAGINGRNSTYNQTLSLDLTQTNCGVQGATAAVKCQTVTSLRLFNNKLGSKGFEALVPLLQGGHKSLINLDLGGNDASEAAVVKLLTAIADTQQEQFVSTLQVLEIGGNSGGNAVEDAIAKLKQVHPELDVARDRPRGQSQL